MPTKREPSIRTLKRRVAEAEHAEELATESLENMRADWLKEKGRADHLLHELSNAHVTIKHLTDMINVRKTITDTIRATIQDSFAKSLKPTKVKPIR